MRNKGNIIIILGLLLIAAALSIAVFNVVDEQRAGQSAYDALSLLAQQMHEAIQEEAQEDAAQEPTATDPEQTEPYREMPVERVNGNDYIGVLQIPALELELPIISQWSYSRLRVAPCRFQGSVYSGDLIICGHNYASHFGDLGKLQEGDSVVFVDVEGNSYFYEAAWFESVGPDDVEQMTSGDWDLTLFTCTLGGQTRLTLRCVVAQ